MSDLISESKPKANKDHYCDASDWLNNNGIGQVSFTFSEYRQIVKAKNNKWRIKKGDVYIRQCSKDGSELYTFKAIPSIHQICIDHDLYEV